MIRRLENCLLAIFRNLRYNKNTLRSVYGIWTDKEYAGLTALREAMASVDSLSLIDQLEDIIYVSDPDTHEVLYVNRATLEVLGDQSLEDVIGSKCYKILQGRNSRCPFCSNALLELGKTYTWEFTNKHLNRHFFLRDKLILWNGKPARMEIAVDISKREAISQAMTQKLKIEETLVDAIRCLLTVETFEAAMRAVLQSVGKYYHSDRVYIFELDLEKKVSNMTHEWCRDNVSSLLLRLQNIPIESIDSWLDAFRSRKAVVIPDIEAIRETSPMGYETLSSLEVTSVCGVGLYIEEQLIGYIGVDNPRQHEEDVTLLHSISYFVVNELLKHTMQDRLRFINFHDPLTGLLSLNSYSELLHTVKEETFQSLGVAVGDIDGLKQINEHYGHQYGDDVIRSMADILRMHFDDEYLFRISGDEFLVLCPNVERQDFVDRITAVREKLTHFSVTFGYTWADTDIEVERLAFHADELMRVEKQEYYETSSVSGKRHNPERLQGLLSYLQKGYFEAYLQPKIDVATGELAGAEALARLQDPQHGLLMPNKFIPFLEKCGLIKYVDLFIYERVCGLLASWQEKGYKLVPVSLNFSRITMLEENLIEEIMRIHKKYQVPRQFVEIEITESVGSIERETVAEIGGRIKSKGFRLSLDDFGSAYTSMSILSLINFDVLKLDKSLIHDLISNKNNQAIVRHMIELCHEVGAVAVAEGVETAEHLAVLKKLCCDEAQGYYYDKPIPCADFEKKYLSK